MRRFPKGFRWGWSGAGFQFEMGLPGSEDPNSDWYVWTHDPENIAAGLVSGDLPENGVAYWHLYKQFHEDTVNMGLNTIRFNTEWSRIFPRPTFDVKVSYEVGGGRVVSVDVTEKALEELDRLANKEAVQHYREVFSDIKARGLYFILNLYHWPIPIWLHNPIKVRRGDLSGRDVGWLSELAVVEFAKYAAYIAWKFNDLADEFSTMNEPNVTYSLGFINVKAGFPPAHLSFDLSRRAAMNIISAHARAYDAIKALTKKPVGIIYAASPVYPLTEADKEAAEMAERDGLWFFLDAVAKGVLDGAQQEDLKGRLDWLGVNYYARTVVVRRGAGYAGVPGYGFACEPDSISRDGRPTSDFGWEIYPEGLYDLLVKLWRRYNIRMYVTENGIADAYDRWRPYYLVSHIAQLHRAVSEGVEVGGYLHWSLTDNYEWASGFSKKFGLIYVDLSTKRHYWRPSAYIYREIARANGVPDELEHLEKVPAALPEIQRALRSLL
jgi:beta-galactosidase